MESLHRRSHGDGRWAGENSGQGSRHSSVGSGALMLHRRLPADAGHAVHVPTSLEIRDQVNRFLHSLPLGVTRRDAELEDCIAAHLHDLHSARAGVQLKLSQWVSVALGLQEVVERQHAELAKLHEAQRAQRANKHPQQQHSRGLPETVRHNHASNNGMDLTLAAQYAELAQISAQMASLREDLASAARPGNAAAAAAAPPAAPADQEGVLDALKEQLQASTAETQASRAEADRLRSALLTDAELELQQVTSANAVARREEQDKARLAAEAVAAAHQTRQLQECVRRQAGEITRLRAAVTAGGAASADEEGTPQEAALGQLTAKRHALEQQVAELQGRVQKATAEREEALARAQSEQQVLLGTAGTLQAKQVEALAAERAAKEELAQEYQAFREEAEARHGSILRQMAADAADAAAARSLREELSLERRHCSALEAALAERDAAAASLQQELEGAVRALETALADRESACAGLQQELAQAHSQSEGAVKALEAALAEQQPARDSLECEKSRLEGVVSALEAELAGTKEALEEEVRRRTDELEALTEVEEALENERARSSQIDRALEEERERSAVAEQALEEERERCAQAEEARAADAGRLRQQLAELACQVDDERAATAKGATTVADLSARLAVADATWQAQHREAMLDLQAAHSEELERLQSEHARELAALAAAAEADREHSAAVAAALRLRAEPISEPTSPSPSSASVLRGCTSHRSSPELSTAALGPTALSCLMHELRPTPAADAGATEAGKVLQSTGGELDDSRSTDQANVGGDGHRDAAGAAQGRAMLAMLAAMALNSARPPSPADAVCRVTLGRPAMAAGRGRAPAAAGSAVSQDAHLLYAVKEAELAGSDAAAEESAGARATPSQTGPRPAAERLQAEHGARVARERERGEAALVELQSRHAAELAALQQHSAAEELHDSAVQEQQERLTQNHSADLAALQRRQDMALAELQNEPSQSAALGLELPEMSLGYTQEQRPEKADIPVQSQATLEASHEQLAAQTQEHMAALAALEDRLHNEHAAELAALEQQHREAASQMQESLTQAHAAELAELQGRLTTEVAELRSTHSAAVDVMIEQRVEQAADAAEQHASAAAELHARVEERHRSQLAALQEELAARHGAEVAALRSQHASALAELQARQDSQRMEEMAAVREELEARIAAAEQAAAGERERCAAAEHALEGERKRHEAQLLAMLARQFEAGALADAEALGRRSAQLAAVEQQHREALQQLRQEMESAHASEMSALKEQHMLLTATHASELAALKEQQMQVLAQTREDLTASHAAELANLRTKQMEALAEKEAELAEAYEEDVAELRCLQAHDVEALSNKILDMEDEHEETVVLLREELAGVHSAALAAAQQSHEAQMRDLRQQHGEAMARVRGELAASGQHPVTVQSAQLAAQSVAESSAQHASSHETQLDEPEQQEAEVLSGDIVQQPAGAQPGQEDVHGELAREQEEAGSPDMASLEQQHREEQAPLEEAPEKEQGKAGLPDITDMEQQHREEVQRLTEEYSQEIERIRCECVLQVAVMEEVVANARANSEERVQRYKEELKAAKEALHLAQQQTSLQHEAHKEAEEEFVIHRRGTRAAGTPLNRAWQTERKPSLRHAMAQLEADNVDLLARCCTAESAAATESAAADALRAENLELASELADADAARHTAADAAREAREKLVSLHLMVQEPSSVAAPGAVDEATRSDADDTGALAEAVQALTERCKALEADNARLQAQVGGALGEELQELQEACLSMRRSNEDLAAQLAALGGGDAAGDTHTLAEETAALRGAHAELEAKVEALVDASAVAEENAALRRMLADLDAELAALAAEMDRLRDENLELSSAVAAQSVDATELQEMAATLAERDAIEEDLRAQLSDLYALEQARGSPETSASDSAKLVAAQLRVEALEAQLRTASAEQVQQDSTGVCSRCGEALSFSEGTPEKGSPGKEAASRAPDGAADAAGAPGEGGAAVVSGGSPPAAANGGPIVLADGGLGGRGEDPATQDGGPLQALRGAHAAELVSVQNAFTARMQALQEDLQQKDELLERQQEQLEAAAEEVASRQEALLECQDMLAELQAFSEAQQAQLHALQQGLQGAQGQASQARAAAQEAEEQLRGQQERAEEAARQLEEAQSALALRDGTLQELTLENQRLQLELSETRGRLRATEAAAAESSGRVESLAARLAATHNAKPIGMIWQNPSQGGELSATGSGSIVEALQGPSREVVLRVPSRPASPAAAAAAADVSNDNVIHPPAVASRESQQRKASDAKVHENRIHAEHAMQPSPSLAASPFKERAATNAAASGWESDQENDGSGRECYSLPPPPHRNAAQRLQERQPAADSAAFRNDSPTKHLENPHADASPVPNSPFGSLHNNALFGESGSPSSPEICWSMQRNQIAETPTPLRSRDNPVRGSGGSPFRSGRSSPLRGRKSLRASQGSSPLRTLHRRDKAQERDIGSHALEGGPLRDAQELQGSGGSSPERTRDLPRRCKSGPLQAGSRVVAAQRSLFLSPPVEAALPLPSPPDGVRDIAGRWHGTPSPQWHA